MNDILFCSCGRNHWISTITPGWDDGVNLHCAPDTLCYCSCCGDRLSDKGGVPSVTRMVPAQPAEAVRETVLYRLLRDMAGVDALALAEKDGGWELAGLGLAAGDVVEDAPPRTGWDGEYIPALIHAEFSITPDGRAILAVLEGAGQPDADSAALRRALEWLAETMEISVMGSGACSSCRAREACAPPMESCSGVLLAAALAAASAPDAGQPTDTELFDALESTGVECDQHSGKFRAWVDEENDVEGCNLRDLASQILAYRETGGTVSEDAECGDGSDILTKPDHELYECPGDGLCPYCDEMAQVMNDMAPGPEDATDDHN